MSKIFNRRSLRHPARNPMSIHLHEDDDDDFDDSKSESSECGAMDTIKAYKFPLAGINLQRIQTVTAGPRFTMPEIDVSIGVHRVIPARHLIIVLA